MNLTAENVEKTILYLLFKDGEDSSNHVVGEGVISRMGFHPGRLSEKISDISSMLDCLHDNFKANIGGGSNFLNACETKDGVQWADAHSTVDKLVMLGYAAGKLRFVMPREMWSMFPGGVPYFVVQ
jgi:hypothetical protein